MTNTNCFVECWFILLNAFSLNSAACVAALARSFAGGPPTNEGCCAGATNIESVSKLAYGSSYLLWFLPKKPVLLGLNHDYKTDKNKISLNIISWSSFGFITQLVIKVNFSE
jgi:hypothetical protein